MKPYTVGRSGGREAAGTAVHTTGLRADGLLLTATGERPVGALRPGDRVITRNAGMVALRAIAWRRLHVPMVRIRAGSLGHNRPGRDALLPADQPILVRDWRAQALFGRAQAMVSVARLVDGAFVTHEGSAMADFCELDFGAPHILYLDGLEVANHAIIVPAA
jgi:hypothetical protein